MEFSEENVPLSAEKSHSVDLCELTEDVAGEESIALNESEINTSICNVTAASELTTAEETCSEDDATVPMKKRSYLDLRELTKGVDIDDTTVADAGEITPSTGNATSTSELATAEETCSEDDGTVPMKKRSYLDLRELTKGVDIDDTTVIDAVEITPSTSKVTAASELATAEEKSSEINITLPLEKRSALDVSKSSEVLRTQGSRNGYEGEITASSHNVITGQDLFIAADEYFEGIMSPPMEKVALVDGADHGEATATDATTSKDAIEIAASINDVSAAPQIFFGVDGSAEDISLPLEKLSSQDVLKPAEAFAAEETPITDEGEVTSSIHGSSAASEVLMIGETPSDACITLPVEKLSLLEVHGPLKVVTGETIKIGKVETTTWPYDGITAEKALSEDTTLPVENIASLEVHQPTKAVATEETANLDADKIAATTCDDTPVVEEHFQDESTLHAERISSLEVNEPAKAIAREEITTFSDDKIAATTCDGTPAVREQFQDETTPPAETISVLEVTEPAKAIATEEITTFSDDKIVATACDATPAVQENFQDESTLPAETISVPEVHEPDKAIATEEITNFGDDKIVATACDATPAVQEHFQDETTLPAKTIFVLEVHEPAKVIATEEITNFGDDKIVATTCDDIPAVQEHFQDETTLPAEMISSLEVHEPTKAVATDEITTFGDDKIAATTCDGTPAVQENFQDESTLPAENIFPLEVHEPPTKAVATEEITNFGDDKIAATTCDGTPAVKVRSQDKITLPEENIFPLEVHELTKAIATEEITNFGDDKIAATTCDGTPAVKGRSQDKITLPVERVSSLDVHEPANSVLGKITIDNYDVNATCKHFVLSLVQLSACSFHWDTCIVSFLIYGLYNRLLRTRRQRALHTQ